MRYIAALFIALVIAVPARADLKDYIDDQTVVADSAPYDCAITVNFAIGGG